MSTARNLSAMEITSPQNPRYKAWIRSLDGKGVKKTGEAIFSGKKFLGEMFARFPERVKAVLAQRLSDLEPYTLPRECRVFLLPGEMFARLDIYGVNAPILVLDARPFPAWNNSLAPGLTLFLPFQNPINLGTTIRTAAGIGAEVVLLREASSPYQPKSLRASGPGIFQTPIRQGPSLAELAELARGGSLPLYALSLDGENIFKAHFPETLGLVAGMEGPGLDALWPKCRRLHIPMKNAVESLNASVAVAMAVACRLRNAP